MSLLGRCILSINCECCSYRAYLSSVGRSHQTLSGPSSQATSPFSTSSCSHAAEGVLSTSSTPAGQLRTGADTTASPSHNASRDDSSSDRISTNSTPASISSPSTSSRKSSIDRHEAAKFAALADHWWDTTSGPFAPLHALNAARCKFIRQAVCGTRGIDANTAKPFHELSALDVGCGGGLLSEPLARLGACVHGIDVSEESVSVATAHAAGDCLLQQRIRLVDWYAALLVM